MWYFCGTIVVMPPPKTIVNPLDESLNLPLYKQLQRAPHKATEWPVLGPDHAPLALSS